MGPSESKSVRYTLLCKFIPLKTTLQTSEIQTLLVV